MKSKGRWRGGVLTLLINLVSAFFLLKLLNNFFKESLPKEFLVLFRNWINDPNPSVGKMSLQKIASMAPVFSEVCVCVKYELCVS